MAGQILENYVVTEIIKSFYNALNNNPRIYFYRDKDMKKIDLLIEKNNTIYPIKIKKHADPRIDDIRHFKVLDKFANVTIGQVALISFYDNIINITNNVVNVPISYL